MKAAFHDDRLRFLIGDVRDEDRMLSVCRGIDIVIHAAALKRVEICEGDPDEAVATNVMGSQYVARACVERGVAKACFLSTDKAAHPNTLYGMTKAAAERVWLNSNVYAAGTATRFTATRYGNVLGSRGSVVPVWRQQATSGAITVTSGLATRFWMSMADAVDLVMLALREMRGGEIFVPKIGASSVSRLADVIAPTAEIRRVGLRPGEKMHETLVTEDEARNTYDAGDVYIIEPDERTWGEVTALPFPKVRSGFVYRSDDADLSLPIEELRRMVAA
jgi:UDP-N-acetylglucosamine 4,6-dehydratase